MSGPAGSKGVYPQVIAVVAILAIVAVAVFYGIGRGKDDELVVGIAPYQDLAMLVNIGDLQLEKKYGTKIRLNTMAWEDILPAVASAGRGLDVGFASYIEYLTKYPNINTPDSDKLVFVYPLYVYKGGGFVTFRKDIQPFTPNDVRNKSRAQALLSYKIGAQKGSLYEMMLLRLATVNGISPDAVKFVDTPLDQGFLAAENGSLDLATAGLTQLTETLRRGGSMVLTMDDIGIADITGFVVKQSTLKNRPKDVENLIRMWFDCVDHVYTDIDRNSRISLAYLDKNASTRYTLEEYKKALSAEYLPRTVGEAKSAFTSSGGKFEATVIGQTANDLLVRRGVLKQPSPIPQFIGLKP